MRADFEVDGCEFDFKCPKKWTELQETEDSDRRFCNACDRDVHAVWDGETLEKLRQERKCVAVFPKIEELKRKLTATTVGVLVMPKRPTGLISDGFDNER